ncbi:hypothetical protein AAFF_G00048700 [Aldrovandia affinis]|uniref:Uncharacterized protein n=1 Tax=Aldrovandia affinis TaxID=143900 RepID=A0AAD7WEQ4_9TELE|nr:hypothetical protein AAFF_G00048700 [Aldrovandia affinis]
MLEAGPRAHERPDLALALTDLTDPVDQDGGQRLGRFQDSSVFNETLRISKIQRHQGGRYYCKAENGLGSPAIKSIRVDVYCE